jgi:predicted glycoside hydrolase/deacetylase ChbG (UPF0249 family)
MGACSRLPLLKRNPQIAVGVHLTPNSEWRNYRWGPVLGKAGAPTMVDDVRYFLPSTDEFLERRVDLGEVERELDAQMDRTILGRTFYLILCIYN